jgi:hypothetical protein
MTLFWQFTNTPPQHLVYSGIIMEAMRESWTDDRMDDLVKRVDTGFAQVHEDIAELRADNKELRREMATFDGDRRAEMGHLASREELHAEIQAVRSEMREGFDKVDERFDQVIATFNRRFDTLILTLIAAMIAAAATLIGAAAT